MSDFLTDRMRGRLRQLEAELRLREPGFKPGINLCSNDYLGLAEDPRLKAAVLDAIANCERTGSTGSRLLSGHDPAWNRLEEEFAAFAGTDAALFFTSGYAANTGLLSALLGKDDVVFSDALNHASMIDGIRLSRARKVVYPHTDLNALEDALRHNHHASGARVIVTESIFSMDGDRAPLLEIFSLAGRYGAEVIVDEAHATGVCGPLGRGLAAELGLQPLAAVHTCGKALASMGAFVCGSKTLRKFLINHARGFMFSTALPPYAARQVGAALRLASGMEAERRQLASLAENLREALAYQGFCCGRSNSHIVPVMVGSEEAALRLAAAVEEHGFAVRAIRPPTVPVGTARLRLSMTARLQIGDIQNFVHAVSAAAVGPCHV